MSEKEELVGSTASEVDDGALTSEVGAAASRSIPLPTLLMATAPIVALRGDAAEAEGEGVPLLGTLMTGAMMAGAIVAVAAPIV